MTFNVSGTGTIYSTSKSAGITITSKSVAKVDVIGLFISSYDVLAGFEPLTITVNTPANAKYLHMANENGSIVKTWSVGYSTLIGSERVWEVSHIFTGVGSRNMTIYASIDGATIGNGREFEIEVIKTYNLAKYKDYMFDISSGEYMYFIYKPSYSGKLTVRSDATCDVLGRLMEYTDGEIVELTENDDIDYDNDNLNFEFNYNVTAGKTYLIEVYAYSYTDGGILSLQTSLK